MVKPIELKAMQVRIDMIEQALRHADDLPAIRVLILGGEWIGLKKSIGESWDLGALLNRFREGMR